MTTTARQQQRTALLAAHFNKRVTPREDGYHDVPNGSLARFRPARGQSLEEAADALRCRVLGSEEDTSRATLVIVSEGGVHFCVPLPI